MSLLLDDRRLHLRRDITGVLRRSVEGSGGAGARDIAGLALALAPLRRGREDAVRRSGIGSADVRGGLWSWRATGGTGAGSEAGAAAAALVHGESGGLLEHAVALGAPDVPNSSGNSADGVRGGHDVNPPRPQNITGYNRAGELGLVRAPKVLGINQVVPLLQIDRTPSCLAKLCCYGFPLLLLQRSNCRYPRFLALVSSPDTTLYICMDSKLVCRERGLAGCSGIMVLRVKEGRKGGIE